MGLDELQPGNTKRAKATAVKAFGRFLDAEEVSLEYVKICIERDAKGQAFVSVMDKFGMYLAFNEGKNGKPLARHSAMQYYKQVKIWLLEQFPQHRASLETRLLKIGRTLENFCVKREGGGFVKKATASMRVRLVTTKMQLCCVSYGISLGILDNGDAYIELQPPNTDAADIAPTIHSHVNRLLDRIAKSAGVLEQLTSHSFRRGGAQHANGSADLTARWIFDRGA
ncbi:hypothetical protein FI667_g4266, partial [Globisporangium splendens]